MTDQPLWHGRFESSPAEALLKFTESLSFDKQLWRDDIIGSTAHVRGLVNAKIISVAEGEKIILALNTVATEMSSGKFEFVASDEDIHTAIERRVTQLAGDAGAKLHTGRSRNDQVATALRLWCKRELAQVAKLTLDLCDVLTRRANEAGWGADAVYLPGYTHLQRAQPVLLAHHFAAHVWAMLRDVDRLTQTIERLDVSPLGAGALAGSSLPIDADFVASELGFARRFDNSLDAVSDRDFVAEALFDIALIGVHLSRLGEEWVLWTTQEFGFAVLDDAYSTGSSMLPQKKNADIAELARGKSGRLIGNLTGLLATLKAMPLAYNRDLQEDKEPLFDSVNQVSLALQALAGMIATARFNKETMKSAADVQMLGATDLAEWLVAKGMPFRQAHAHVGALVSKSIRDSVSLAQLVEADSKLGKQAAELLQPGIGISRRTTKGGSGPVPGAVQIAELNAALTVMHTRIAALTNSR
ncbi:MAG: argininosuccinate lyase [Actinomycetota bacterium]|nr:argininosuccinate lyase [Actinomycetota bacterium]MDA3003438.1 argininosuccinate lyase [Actinomycetota bacterium]